MDDLSQNQEGGNNSTNLLAGRDINLVQAAQAEQRDFGIIDEIFKSVIRQLQEGEHDLNRDHTNLNKKIEINFGSKEERERIQQYFKYAYTKVALLEKRMREEDSETQKSLHSHIFAKYNALKDKGSSSMKILEELCEQFIIPGKKDNPEYTEIARAFVLFFFDDCTIFEK